MCTSSQEQPWGTDPAVTEYADSAAHLPARSQHARSSGRAPGSDAADAALKKCVSVASMPACAYPNKSLHHFSCFKISWELWQPGATGERARAFDFAGAAAAVSISNTSASSPAPRPWAHRSAGYWRNPPAPQSPPLRTPGSGRRPLPALTPSAGRRNCPQPPLQDVTLQSEREQLVWGHRSGGAYQI